MQDRNNTIAGWVLFAGIVALGGVDRHRRNVPCRAPREDGLSDRGRRGRRRSGAEAEKPIAFYLAAADAAKGEQVFKKCAACHNADPGGANALGPSLYGVMGKPACRAPRLRLFRRAEGRPAAPGTGTR